MEHEITTTLPNDDPMPLGLAHHLALARSRALGKLRQQATGDDAVAALVVVADAILAKLGEIEHQIADLEERVLRERF